MLTTDIQGGNKVSAKNGNCYICGKTVGKTALKNHIIKDHVQDCNHEEYKDKITFIALMVYAIMPAGY